jgi:hypothetical protein
MKNKVTKLKTTMNEVSRNIKYVNELLDNYCNMDKHFEILSGVITVINVDKDTIYLNVPSRITFFPVLLNKFIDGFANYTGFDVEIKIDDSDSDFVNQMMSL